MAPRTKKTEAKNESKNELKNEIKLTTEHITTAPTTGTVQAGAGAPTPAQAQVVETCDICVEKFNQSFRCPVKCEYCDFKACRECCERYILMESEAHCMASGCARPWTHEFVSKTFTKKFVTQDLKLHREKVLFDKQRALLPATQPLVENILKREDYMRRINAANEVVNQARRDMNKIQSEYFAFINRGKGDNERATFIRACPSPDCRGFLSSQWKCGICNLWTCPTCHEIKGADRDGEHVCDPNNVATANLLNADTKPCPKCGEGIFKIDGCFAPNVPILMWDSTVKMSQDIVVGDVLVGDDGQPRNVIRTMQGEDEMYEVVQSDGASYTVNSKHTLTLKYKYLANPLITVDIRTDDYMKLTDEEKSYLLGYKVAAPLQHSAYPITVTGTGRGQYYGWTLDGSSSLFLMADKTCLHNCSQMFCTICHTAFDWRTGRVETGPLHNPHYYEWMRRNGTLEREANDVPCGREINHHIFTTLRTLFSRHESTDTENAPKLRQLLNQITEYARLVIHYRYASLPRYQYNSDDITQQLRIQYMRNFICEDYFKVALQKEYKKSCKYREICDVIQLLIATMTDIIFRFVDELKKPEWKHNLDHIDEIKKIMEYADECFLKISRTYSSVPLRAKYL